MAGLNEPRLMYWEQLGYHSKPNAVLLQELRQWRFSLAKSRHGKHIHSWREPDLCAEAYARMILENQLKKELEQEGDE